MSLARTLIRHRALISALLVRQLKARYRGSVLGFFWTFLNPLLLMSVYALVFRFYMRIPVESYALFLLSGLLPWIWFSASLSEGAGAILGGGALVTKSLFPAEVLPCVVVLNHMVNFILSLPLLVAAGWLYGVSPHPALWLCLPIVLLLQLALTLGLVLALASLNVHYRDIQHILANMLLLWFFVTPILYPLSQVPQAVRSVLMLNPLAQLAAMYQGLFFDMRWPDPAALGAVTVAALLALAVGTQVFDAYRDTFAELV